MMDPAMIDHLVVRHSYQLATGEVFVATGRGHGVAQRPECDP